MEVFITLAKISMLGGAFEQQGAGKKRGDIYTKYLGNAS